MCDGVIMKSGAVLEPGVVLSLKVCACVFINGTCINYDMSHFFITFLFFCSNEMLILSCLVDIYILENCESNGAHHEKISGLYLEWWGVKFSTIYKSVITVLALPFLPNQLCDGRFEKYSCKIQIVFEPHSGFAS